MKKIKSPDRIPPAARPLSPLSPVLYGIWVEPDGYSPYWLYTHSISWFTENKAVALAQLSHLKNKWSTFTVCELGDDGLPKQIDDIVDFSIGWTEGEGKDKKQLWKKRIG